ncbi:MAG: DEAD/DEAH box helicase, partial [Methanoculleus sp.]|nr:DEAD/DEAH box helicase [Methanoculleus sp.]
KRRTNLVRYADRPVALERHLIFTERSKKIGFIKQMVVEEYKVRSSKGYRGQTIVFTNSRARCHVIADALGKSAAPYHAGLTAQERRDVERRFANGEIAAVVTTAALAAGVDFPASQVIFDALAMGIKWLSVQEFYQMMGRAGRPDFHDLGRVVIMAEPGGSYSRASGKTEEEVAVGLLRGEMEEVAPEYDMEQSTEEFVANAVVCGGDEQQVIKMTHTMVGALEPALPTLLDYGLVRRRAGRIELTDMARVMAEHFIGAERLIEIRDMVQRVDDAAEIIAELECAEEKTP